MVSNSYKNTMHETLESSLHYPHNLLGIHSRGVKNSVIRLYRPNAPSVHFELFGRIVEAKKIQGGGLFEYEVPATTTYQDYRIYHGNGLLAYDPYAFLPSIGELDIHLFSKGVHYELYKIMGARLTIHQGFKGVKFAVWAPNALGVSVVGDFNFWDGRVNPMRCMGESGIWELFIPGMGGGEKYKFEIKTVEGHLRLKSDPYAYASEMRPATASIVCDIDAYTWNDQKWIKKREKRRHASPLNIYEVHLGSWKKAEGEFLNYRLIAKELASYCKEMHFSHVELMPILEHPLDESWGYQVTGFFAATSRFGTPSDFQYFVDHLHNEGIGVLLDWVPGHFPMDDFALAQFDGSYLYEHADPQRGIHPHWNTYIFNYGRVEVSNFLIASALFWLEKMHIDGLRVDAVASMLYLDYGRNEGEWSPNIYGKNENLEAIEFLKHLNSVVHERIPGSLMCAEESTSFLGVTHSLEQGGLGFDLKWNMGWMNDTLKYFHQDPLYRQHHHRELSFGIMYAFTEQFLLVLSHDEVVHGKKNLLSKMPGDEWQKFANMRLLYSYMICHPGKKLLFMGGEFGQWDEWNCKKEIEWHLLRFYPHIDLQKCVRALNLFYHENDALWERDCEAEGFEWVDFSDSKNSVISYLRKSSNKILFCIHNFTPNLLENYFVSLTNASSIKEVFNTDSKDFGGSCAICEKVTIMSDEIRKHHGFNIKLSPLSTMIFEVQFAK